MAKYAYSFILFLGLLSISGCKKEKPVTDISSPSNSFEKDTVISLSVLKEGIPTSDTLWLEDLGKYDSHEALVKKFGEKEVIKGTIYGPEGIEIPGTLLYPGTNKTVEILWANEKQYKKFSSASVSARFDEKKNTWSYNSPWRSKKGIGLGSLLAEIEALNGKPFEMSGFGWDYGGNITDFKGGKLDSKNIWIELVEGSGKLTEEEYNTISGDQIISSDNVTLRKCAPRVSSLGYHQ